MVSPHAHQPPILHHVPKKTIHRRDGCQDAPRHGVVRTKGGVAHGKNVGQECARVLEGIQQVDPISILARFVRGVIAIKTLRGAMKRMPTQFITTRAKSSTPIPRQQDHRECLSKVEPSTHGVANLHESPIIRSEAKHKLGIQRVPAATLVGQGQIVATQVITQGIRHILRCDGANVHNHSPRLTCNGQYRREGTQNPQGEKPTTHAHATRNCTCAIVPHLQCLRMRRQKVGQKEMTKGNIRRKWSDRHIIECPHEELACGEIKPIPRENQHERTHTQKNKCRCRIGSDMRVFGSLCKDHTQQEQT
jgi:hypothetical protein